MTVFFPQEQRISHHVCFWHSTFSNHFQRCVYKYTWKQSKLQKNRFVDFKYIYTQCTVMISRIGFVQVRAKSRDCQVYSAFKWRYLRNATPMKHSSTEEPKEGETTITKTYLYNFDPIKPHFYIIKLGFTWVNIIFLISAQKHRLWGSRRF